MVMDKTTRFISREEAKGRGLRKFFTKLPCKHGHITDRYVSSGKCVQCECERVQNWNETNPGKNYARVSAWRKTNLDKARSQQKRHRVKNPHAKTLRLLEPDERIRALGTPKPEVCPICMKAPEQWHLDHCHVTGRFNDWICGNCNTAKGLLYDSMETMERLIRYTQRTSK